MKNLKAHLWILRDLQEVDLNQILPVLPQDPINRRLRNLCHQLLYFPMLILENRILDHLRVRLREIGQRRLLP